jgi:hypothetical protein
VAQKRLVAGLAQVQGGLSLFPDIERALNRVLANPQILSDLKELRENIAPRATAVCYSQIIKKTNLLELICSILASAITVSCKIECIFILQNLALVSSTHQNEMRPLVLVLMHTIEHQSLDGNFIILKDAAVSCLGCICIDCPGLLQLLDLKVILDLTSLKRT